MTLARSIRYALEELDNGRAKVTRAAIAIPETEYRLVILEGLIDLQIVEDELREALDLIPKEDESIPYTTETAGVAS